MFCSYVGALGLGLIIDTQNPFVRDFTSQCLLWHFIQLVSCLYVVRVYGVSSRGLSFRRKYVCGTLTVAEGNGHQITKLKGLNDSEKIANKDILWRNNKHLLVYLGRYIEQAKHEA